MPVEHIDIYDVKSQDKIYIFFYICCDKLIVTVNKNQRQMNNTANNQALVDALKKNLPEDSSEEQVSHIFASELFNFLGFELNERVPSFFTGSGNKAVDHALRHNRSNDIFSQTKTNPDQDLRNGTMYSGNILKIIIFATTYSGTA